MAKYLMDGSVRPARNNAAVAEATRPRIDATKGLTLDERVAILDNILGDWKGGFLAANASKQLAKDLELRGYEPMMFQAAFRIIVSRSSPK